MELRTIITGIVVTIIALVFITLGVRSCSRDTGSSSGTSSAQAASDGAFDPSRNLTDCVADPETGLCFPQVSNAKPPFDWDAFMATVREHQLSSSSSSSRSLRSGWSLNDF